MAETGPPYPPLPSYGSNAIGRFAIGISPIGTIVPFVYWQTIISQYSNSPILTQLIGNFDAYVDQTQNFDAFYDLIWNVDTAQGYGLEIWGRIVGVSKTLQVQVGTNFGFQEAGTTSAEPFNQAAFYAGAPLTTNYQLSDDAFRTLIFAKALANISDGSIPSINQLLLNLFPGRGNCYVTDGVDNGTYFGFAEAVNCAPFNQASFYAGETLQSMVMSYVFDFQLSPVEIAIVEQSGVLPKPVGVAASTVIL